MSSPGKKFKTNLNSSSKEAHLIRDDEIFLRMNVVERIQHFILIITFLLLIVTGLPLFFYEIKFLNWLFSLQNSFYWRGIIHRVAAVLLILNIIWHVLYTLFTSRGRNNFKEIIPRFKDFKDAFEILWHHVGLTRFLYRKGILKKFFTSHSYWLFEDSPEYGRYNFIEKFEYWAVAWGSVVMIISGFFMWNVELSLSIFPLWIHDIFIIVHGYEAILAFLAVIIWHMYNVHFNPEVFPMSKVWLTGKITGKELRTLHPLEYKNILKERKKSSEVSSAT
jgi:cytochrome b subunit of formate dehydrogenase